MAMDPDIKRQNRLLAEKKRRSTSRQHQKDFRKEQMNSGRKAVTIWVDPDYYELLKEAKEKYDQPNIRETTYLCLKKGIDLAMAENTDDETT